MSKKLALFLTQMTGAMLISAASTGAHAATLEELGLSSDAAGYLESQLYYPGSSPAISFGSPIGFGAGYTEFIAGIGGQTLPEGSQDSVDGSMSVGVGIGDPTKWVGLEVSSTIISLQDDFGADGNFNFKLHHAIPSYRMSVAVGVENTGRWGDAKQTESAKYAVVSKVFDASPVGSNVPMSLAVTAGAGDGRFSKPGEDTINPFGAVALSLFRRVSVIADWTGRDLNAGISFLPLARLPVVVSLGAINLTERYGASVEFAGGIGYTYRFK